MPMMENRNHGEHNVFIVEKVHTKGQAVRRSRPGKSERKFLHERDFASTVLGLSTVLMIARVS
jgi:hypothetical protein